MLSTNLEEFSTSSPNTSYPIIVNALEQQSQWMSGNVSYPISNSNNGSNEELEDSFAEPEQNHSSHVSYLSTSRTSLDDMVESAGLYKIDLCNEYNGEGGDSRGRTQRDWALTFEQDGPVPEIETYHCLSDIHVGAPHVRRHRVLIAATHSTVQYIECSTI